MNCFVGEVIIKDYKAVPKEVISLNDLPEDQQTLLKLRVSTEINISHTAIRLQGGKEISIILLKSSGTVERT